MFDFFKKSKKAPAKPSGPPEVLGLRLGGAVELNDLRLRLLDEQLITEGIARMQLIQAVGVIQLDTAHHILRYYTDDDAFFQVVLEGGMKEEHVADVKLFHFYKTQGIATEAEWNTLLDSGISRPTFDCEGHSFTRVWEAVGKNPPVAMTERTHTEGEPVSETDQFVMLYERPLEDDLREFLFVSGEEKIIGDQHDRCLVISTGINLNQADFEVVG